MLIPDHIQEQIEQLDLTLKGEGYPPEIGHLLGKTVLQGGKRLRPLLLFLVGDFFKLPLQKLKPFAEAIEQIHAASLSHDDVIDNGTIRRGRPTINQVGGNKYAVLAGDYLLADVLSKIVDQDCPYIMKETARVIQALAQGEWLQLELAKSGVADFEELKKIALNKTGSVLSWCLVVPAVLAGLSDPQIEIMRNIGYGLGLAFQMIDDSLDFGNGEFKDSNIDFENGQINFVMCDYFMRNPSDLGVNVDISQKEQLLSQQNIRNLALSEIENVKSCFRQLLKDHCEYDQGSADRLFEVFDLLVLRNY